MPKVQRSSGENHSYSTEQVDSLLRVSLAPLWSSISPLSKGRGDWKAGKEGVEFIISFKLPFDLPLVKFSFI